MILRYEALALWPLPRVSRRDRARRDRFRSDECRGRARLRKRGAVLAITLGLGCPSHGFAQDGAASLSQDYQDWRVLCTRQGDDQTCLMRQDQTRSNGERLLAVEIRQPQREGTLGTLLLPFGIRFDAGIRPRIDENPPLGSLSFRTCLPSGCLAVLPINARTVDQLRSGTSLELEVTTIGGEELSFSVSLRGFTAAYRHLAETGEP